MKRFSVLRNGDKMKLAAIAFAAFVVGAPALAEQWPAVFRNAQGVDVVVPGIYWDTVTGTLVTDATVKHRWESTWAILAGMTYNPGTGKLQVRGVNSHEYYDSPDTNCGRAGPDNGPIGVPPATTNQASRLCRTVYQTYITGLGWNGPTGGFAGAAEITGYADGVQGVIEGRPGRICLRTTIVAEHGPRDRLCINNAGVVRINLEDNIRDNPAFANRPSLAIGREFLVGTTTPANTGLTQQQVSNARRLNVIVDATVVADFRKPAGASQTGFMVTWLNGAVVRSDVVVIGGTSSCGSGFRCLRIPN